MDWSNIPSLASLRAFEAASRLGSFTKAAAELNVTHAAIAQHVRSIESDLGLKLLERSGRGMRSTEEGRQLSNRLSEGFREIARGIDDLRKQQVGRPLTITTTLTFTETWLMPRLPDFWSKNPSAKVSISPSMEKVNLQRDGYDLGIRFGQGEWDGLQSSLILPAEFVVVAAPEIAKKIVGRPLDMLTNQAWLRDVNYPEPLSWLSGEGLSLDHIDWRDVPSQPLMLAAARAGGGIAAINQAVARDDLANGSLELLHEAQPSGQGYFLVEHNGVPHSDASRFKKWILGAARG